VSASDDGATRLLDTTAAFEQFAKQAFLQPMPLRTDLWHREYEGAHPEVFEALRKECGELAVTAVVRNLSQVRKMADEAGSKMPELIEEVEPSVQQALDAPDTDRPLHVLVVGTYTANALVTEIGDDVALLHCLEWYSGPESARVLIAHEDTHAWHRLITRWPKADDLAWRAFAEGLAVRISREVVPDRPEEEYFWYGVKGFEHWLPWCRDNRDELLQRFHDALDDPDAVDAFFGAGFVDGHWRVGFFLADELVGRLETPLRDLVRWSSDDARGAIRELPGA
jgi:hypothetical protein